MPDKGRAFMSSLDNSRKVTYPPTRAYAGQDTFTVIRGPGPGQQRTKRTVTGQVDATGVYVPHPAVTGPAPAEPPASKSRRKTTTHRASSTAQGKH